MDFKPEDYQKLNAPQIKHGKYLIDRILSDNPDREFSLILDVGCGSSNLTRILGDAIPHDRIVAVDIDPNMINFAINNYPASKTALHIEFIIDDISKPWKDLDQRLTNLEGQFDLIFSNIVWHWITEYPQASSNLHHLLKPRGLLYFNIPPTKPILDHVPNGRRQALERYIKLKPQQTERNDWVGALQQSGLSIVVNELQSYEYDFKDPEMLAKFVTLINKYYITFIRGVEFENEKIRYEVVKAMEVLVGKAYSVPTGTPAKKEINLKDSRMYYEVLVIHARKSGASGA